jgi:hypothetical protein
VSDEQPMTREQKVEAIARACHEANRAWCEAHGDLSQATWDLAEDWQRESAIRGIEVALQGATPQQQHGAWMTDKVSDGWRYGPVKDAEAKTHPCIVPYEKLPPMQQIKDALFGAIVRTLAPALGLEVENVGGAVAVRAIAGWSLLVLMAGSTLALVAAYAWDELQWRLIERYARRRR